MKNNGAICFTGYRPNKFDFTNESKRHIYQKLIFEITMCIKYGYCTYYFGAAPGYDLLAGYAAVYLKKAFDIKLVCTLPYENFYLSNEFDEEWRTSYLHILPKCDEVVNVSGKKEKEGDVYMMRNRYMVDNSDMLICFYDGKKGGTQYTVNYAQQKGLSIHNILPL